MDQARKIEYLGAIDIQERDIQYDLVWIRHRTQETQYFPESALDHQSLTTTLHQLSLDSTAVLERGDSIHCEILVLRNGGSRGISVYFDV